MSAIGGINGFITPIMKFFGPFFIVYFLYKLSDILKIKNERAF